MEKGWVLEAKPLEAPAMKQSPGRRGPSGGIKVSQRSLGNLGVDLIHPRKLCAGLTATDMVTVWLEPGTPGQSQAPLHPGFCLFACVWRGQTGGITRRICLTPAGIPPVKLHCSPQLYLVKAIIPSLYDSSVHRMLISASP